MALRQLNQDGRKAVGDEAMKKQEKVVKRNPYGDEAARSEMEPWFKPKPGSIFPKKKKLVKRRMLDYMIRGCAIFCLSGRVTDDGES